MIDKSRIIGFAILAAIVLYIFYKISTGFIGFVIQTIFYIILFGGGLVFLKKKGFFKD
jgi:hypothetical protein